MNRGFTSVHFLIVIVVAVLLLAAILPGLVSDGNGLFATFSNRGSKGADLDIILPRNEIKQGDKLEIITSTTPVDSFVYVGMIGRLQYSDTCLDKRVCRFEWPTTNLEAGIYEILAVSVSEAGEVSLKRTSFEVK